MIRRALAVIVILWSLGLAIFAFSRPDPLGAVKTDGIVVLTGGPKRVARGLDLIERRLAKRLLISGVDRRVRPVELAAEYHKDPGIFTCCIDLDQNSFDTRTNAEETVKWLRKRHYRSIRLITSDWHIARARLEIRRLTGDSVTIRLDPIRTTPDIGDMLLEYNKFLWRLVTLPFDQPA